jgi:hypothetical protein
MKNITASINTKGTNRHAWSIARKGEIGVLREGVATSLSAALREIRKAKKELKK